MIIYMEMVDSGYKWEQESQKNRKNLRDDFCDRYGIYG